MTLSIDPYAQVDRVCLINLERRQDRLVEVQRKLDEVDWPFRPVEVVTAVDGNRCPPPHRSESGGGAWGCIRSHLREVERALNDGIDSLMMLEDDAYVLRPDRFGQECRAFFSAVPADWQFLFLGGQHFGTNPTISPGVVACGNTQRTHAYVVRGQDVMRGLYDLWLGTNCHCDWVLGEWAARYRAYAPAPFLIGQDEGRSDISGSNNPKKSFNSPKADTPICLFTNADRAVIDAVRGSYHFGRTINEQGVDAGLAAALADLRRPNQVRLVRELIDRHLKWEVESGHGQAIGLWCPGLPVDVVHEAVGDKLVVLDGPSVEQALEKLREVTK